MPEQKVRPTLELPELPELEPKVQPEPLPLVRLLPELLEQEPMALPEPKLQVLQVRP